jgi:PhzF family phenazine biosynthesis protein
MPVPYWIVDAFTDQPFAGNPAAVCILPVWRDSRWLQLVAREMNLSETAFLVQRPDRLQLRWFTPCVEVDLCGHATLASAAVLFSTPEHADSSALTFQTKSGPLMARRSGEGIELDFPLESAEAAPAPAGLLEALRADPRYVGRNRMDYLVEVASESELRALAPDFAKLAAVECRGIIVTARADDPQYDFVSRFFAPASGIQEDPVTGSAHCCLVDYWRKQTGKSELTAFQVSQRGGMLRVRMAEGRAYLWGTAVIVAEGNLLL